MRRTILVAMTLALGCASKTAQPLIDAAGRSIAEGEAAARARACAPELQRLAEEALAEARRLEAAGDADAAETQVRRAEELARRARADSPEGCDEPDDAAEAEAAAEAAGRSLSTEPPATVEALQAALQPIYFDYNLAIIREDSRALLSEVARLMKALPEQSLEIEGHCDVRGSTEYNLHLGEQRARSVLKYLVTQGVEPSQLSYISYGEEKPVAFGVSEADHARNRRAELRLR